MAAWRNGRFQLVMGVVPIYCLTLMAFIWLYACPYKSMKVVTISGSSQTLSYLCSVEIKYTIYVLVISKYFKINKTAWTHFFPLKTESRPQQRSRPNSICFKMVLISFLTFYPSSPQVLSLLSPPQAPPSLRPSPCPCRLPSLPSSCGRRAPSALRFSWASCNGCLQAPLQLCSLQTFWQPGSSTSVH